jgi:hypothetical protein
MTVTLSVSEARSLAERCLQTADCPTGRLESARRPCAKRISPRNCSPSGWSYAQRSQYLASGSASSRTCWMSPEQSSHRPNSPVASLCSALSVSASA